MSKCPCNWHSVTLSPNTNEIDKKLSNHPLTQTETFLSFKIICSSEVQGLMF